MDTLPKNSLSHLYHDRYRCSHLVETPLKGARNVRMSPWISSILSKPLCSLASVAMWAATSRSSRARR